MDHEIKERLVKWCEENNLLLDIINEDDVFYRIGKQEDVYMLTYPKEGKIFDNDVCLILDESEIEVLSSDGIKYIIFEFGTRFYYTKLIVFKNEFNDECYEAHFNDLKFIGESTIELNIPFVNLGVHSQYELLNGSHQAVLWADKAVFLKQNAIGICDKNTLGGTMAFQVSCQKKKIKSIIGETVTVAYNYNPDKNEIPETNELKLYVKDEEGWQNLLQISSRIKGDKYAGFIPEKELFSLSSGLVCVFSTRSILNSTNIVEEGIKIINRYKKYFSDVYYQIDTVEYIDDKSDGNHLKEIQLYLKNYLKLVEPVLINDSYYIDKEMYFLKDYINKVSRKIHDEYSEEQHYKTVDESFEKLALLFSDDEKFLELFQKMCNNTVKISDLCSSFEIETSLNKLPGYESLLKQYKKKNNSDIFFELIEDGIQRKLIGKKNINLEIYLARIERELEVIINAKLIDYFLILWDVVNWCKNNNIYVGPARGSAAGSIVMFLINVIEVDPIKHGLLFERFLNPVRFQPDIFYKLTLENGKIEEFKKGTPILLKNGKEVFVEDLKEGDDVKL